MVDKPKKIIGRADRVDFPEYGFFGVPARVDTGAKTSALWASGIHERDGGLVFKLFSPSSNFYTGEEFFVKDYQPIVVASSTGHQQERFMISVLVKLRGKKIRSSFTLADRSRQAYPVLIGRNALRGKFVVDVQSGRPDWHAERRRNEELQGKDRK